VGSRIVVFVQGGLDLSIIQSFVYLGSLLFHRISGHEVYLSILIIPFSSVPELFGKDSGNFCALLTVIVATTGVSRGGEACSLSINFR
jgi:hypothetical protein